MNEKVMDEAGSIHWRHELSRSFGLKTSHEAILWKKWKMLTSHEHHAFWGRMD
jgi:hypothetical protein